MKVVPTELSDVKIIEPDVFGDDRGSFMETWNHAKFKDGGIDAMFVQDNQSRSVKGVLRGLHYQIKQPQGKLVRVLQGEIYDVAVDIRRSSPNFGRWVGVVLSAENRRELWIPAGFAHGFYVLSESADVFYKCTDLYAPGYDRTIRWDDPDIGITWPLNGCSAPILSPKDAAGVSFKEAECF